MKLILTKISESDSGYTIGYVISKMSNKGLISSLDEVQKQGMRSIFDTKNAPFILEFSHPEDRLENQLTDDVARKALALCKMLDFDEVLVFDCIDRF